MARVPTGIVDKIILVLGLGLPEVTRRNNLGDNFAGPDSGSIDIGDRVFCNPLLLIAGVEDGRPIARTNIVPLTIQGGWVVNLKEEFEKLAVAEFGRVEN